MVDKPIDDEPSLRLDPSDVTVAVDNIGRETIVIPDPVAAYMQAQIADGWHEVRGMGYGDSRPFTPVTHMFHLAVVLMAVYAASPVPGGRTGRDVEYARRDREHAASGFRLSPEVVGVSGWDVDARWWRDYDGTRHLHLMGSPQFTKHAGVAAYRWGG